MIKFATLLISVLSNIVIKKDLKQLKLTKFGAYSRLEYKKLQTMFGAFFVKAIFMYFVYIIYSTKLDNYYVGTTDDVERRLNEHNSKKYLDSFTCKGIPWELKLSYLCGKSDTAYKLERFIKRMKSRKFILKIIENEAILDDICENKL